MAFDQSSSSDSSISQINVTPLVDVMLVLLIIMMLVAPMLEQGVSVKLPKAANASPKPQSQDQTIIAIGANRAMYVNAKPVPEAELATRINELFENKPAGERIVVIRADEEVEYGAVMAAMDQLRIAGVEDIGLITEPVAESASGSPAGAQ